LGVLVNFYIGRDLIGTHRIRAKKPHKVQGFF